MIRNVNQILSAIGFMVFSIMLFISYQDGNVLNTVYYGILFLFSEMTYNRISIEKEIEKINKGDNSGKVI